jgi:hypothetical protein
MVMSSMCQATCRYSNGGKMHDTPVAKYSPFLLVLHQISGVFKHCTLCSFRRHISFKLFANNKTAAFEFNVLFSSRLLLLTFRQTLIKFASDNEPLFIFPVP